MVLCPICNQTVKSSEINGHIDSGCTTFIVDNAAANHNSNASSSSSPSQSHPQSQPQLQSQPQAQAQAQAHSISQSQPHDFPPTSTMKRSAADFFATPAAKRQATAPKILTPVANGSASSTARPSPAYSTAKTNGVKRSFEQGPGSTPPAQTARGRSPQDTPMAEAQPLSLPAPPVKRHKPNPNAPLAERVRPTTLDDISGQDLVGPNGVLRALIESQSLPSIILWGGSGTGKTTIARVIANMVGSRFIEINATSSGAAECKKLFQDAANELSLTGRRTIIFCDEIHRFSKAQQDVFLKPVEAGTITLIGATTENPSFKIQAALLSRCRTFTLQKLSTEHVRDILKRALEHMFENEPSRLSPLVDEELLTYLSAFADGDARTALNLLELAISLTAKPPADPSCPLTKEDIKAALTKTLVYDRAGDQHYDTISAFHKAVRGSDSDAALYYLARMLQSGEDPLFVARRMVVIASEDVGLADNSLLSLATATYTAVEKIGMPEARIPLGHCATALCLAPKSTRAYRGLNNAYAALREPGVAGLPIPIHLRNAPTRLMKEMGYGKEYKYNPNYKGGRVRQDYLPDQLLGRKFLEERDLGTEVDPDLDMDG
ncbi:DNA-dependent ATPase mgs1 [Diaporthe australafricana]|uniref:DNA-dependent ATPase mgs1 n=1 Tax=Diaporthe australafricana TaxID=127596 RepID=A0ABR3W840_9PEZI